MSRKRSRDGPPLEEGAPSLAEGLVMDRPGWTAAWSHEHRTWYWWNAKHETTWDDPAGGEPTLVPSEPTPGYGSGGSASSAGRAAGAAKYSTEALVLPPEAVIRHQMDTERSMRMQAESVVRAETV